MTAIYVKALNSATVQEGCGVSYRESICIRKLHSGLSGSAIGRELNVGESKIETKVSLNRNIHKQAFI